MKRRLVEKALRGGFVLTCVREGRRHYCTGFRADDGKWSKFKHRAMMFPTLGLAINAKGRSHAEIVRLRV